MRINYAEVANDEVANDEVAKDIKVENEMHKIEGDSTIRRRHPTKNSTSQPEAQTQANNTTFMPKWVYVFAGLMIVGMYILSLWLFYLYIQDIRTRLGEEQYSGSSFEEDIETSALNQYRVAVRDLGIIMEKSYVITKNGKLISEVLFGLDSDIRDCVDELGNFDHKAKNFIWSLSSEMNSITQEIEKHKSGHADNKFIRERLRALEDRTPGFQEQLGHLIKAIYTVSDSASHTRGYLMDGESEAENVLKEHWVGTIADYTLRKRVEEELLHVRYIIKILRNLAPSLFDFENFLKEYRRRIQEISTESMGVPKEPTVEDLKYLKKAVSDLKKQHEKFSSAWKLLGRKPIDDSDFKEKFSSTNRDCTEFRALLEKPGAYLKSLRIWSSEVVNAMGFFYSDGTSEIYGLPGDGDSHDFNWDKGEKIKEIYIRIGSVLYAIKFRTDRDRVSDWYGGNKGNEYRVFSHAPSIGIHGSFSRQICSVGVIS